MKYSTVNNAMQMNAICWLTMIHIILSKKGPAIDNKHVVRKKINKIKMSFSKEKYLPYISKILLNYLFKTHFQKKISEVWFYNVLSAYVFETEENTSKKWHETVCRHPYLSSHNLDENIWSATLWNVCLKKMK